MATRVLIKGMLPLGLCLLGCTLGMVATPTTPPSTAPPTTLVPPTVTLVATPTTGIILTPVRQEIATLPPAPTSNIVPPPSPDERYTSTVSAGDTLIVGYDATIDGGTLTVWVVAPDGQTVWIETFTQSVVSEAEVSAQMGGEYEIFADADRLRGNYALTFATR